MDPAEYLAFIPLLIYGIGISDLLSQWKRFFKKKDQDALYIIITIMLIEVAIYNVFIYLDIVDAMPRHSYLRYLSFLLPPILFQMLVNVFTPDEGRKTREYFNKNMRLIFALMALFVLSHFVYSFDEHYSAHYIRIVYVILLSAVAVFRKKWLIYIALLLWVVGLYSRAFTMAT
jgi:uncharacterized membrane protein